MGDGNLARIAALIVATSLTAAAHADPVAEHERRHREAPPILVGPDPDDAHEPTTADEARGLEEELPLESEDVALFLPRAVLFLPNLVLKLVAWPIDALLGFVEDHKIVEHVEDFLYNDERTAAIVPSITLSTFFGPTIGARAFHNDLAGHGERGEVSTKFGGQYDHAEEVLFEAERTGGTRLWLVFHNRYESEPDLLFAGLGHVENAPETRYRQNRFMSLARIGYTGGDPGEKVLFGATGIYNVRDLGPGPDDEPSIESAYELDAIPGWFVGPDGVPDGDIHTAELDATLIIDMRDHGGATTSGLYLEAFGGGVLPIDEWRFGHWGVEVTGYIPLYRSVRPVDARVLVLRGAFEAVEGRSSEIPFTDLPRLGGPHRLRGYALDQFREKHAAVATVEYHYPIHQSIAGALYLDAGKVAHHYRDFIKSPAPRFGGGIGFIIRSQEKVLLTIDLAYGDGLQLYITSDPLRAFDDREEEL